MLDRVIIVGMLVAFVCFSGIIVGYVREPDLTIVIAMIVAFALHDFWISVLRPGVSQSGERTDIEERPNPISGKPLAGPKEDYQPGH